LGVVLHGAAAFDQLHTRVLTSAGLWHVYQTLHGVGFSLFVFSLWRMPENLLVRLLSVEPIVYLGRISYGLYVYHNLLLAARRPGSSSATTAGRPSSPRSSSSRPCPASTPAWPAASRTPAASSRSSPS